MKRKAAADSQGPQLNTAANSKRRPEQLNTQEQYSHDSQQQQYGDGMYYDYNDPSTQQQQSYEDYYQQYYAAYYYQQQQQDGNVINSAPAPLMYDPSGNYNTVGKNLQPDVAALTGAKSSSRQTHEQQQQLLQEQISRENEQFAAINAAKSIKIPKAPAVVRAAGGEIWEDPTLMEWDPNDYRLFVGDIGEECNDDSLTQAFRKYPSFCKAKVIRDKKSGKSRGYGFVSFKNAEDYQKAYREMNGKYVSGRPIKLKPSNWKDRTVTQNAAKKLGKFGYAAMIKSAFSHQQQRKPNNKS